MVLHVKEIKEEARVNLDFITTLVFLKKIFEILQNCSYLS